MSWSDRDRKVNWHPFGKVDSGQAIAITHAVGIYLYEENGNRLMDAVSSWWVNLHGHNHPYLVKAANEQLQKLDHVIFAGFTHPKAVELSERLLKFVPGNYSRVFYSDDGSTANEVAIKLALQYFFNRNEKRKKIIAFENAYHGDTFGVMSVSGKSIFNAPFDSHLIPDIIHIPLPVKGYTENEWEQLERVFDENTAAFIFEPLLQGAAGMIMYDAKSLDRLISLAKSKGIITIADEVLTGFGRTGKWFATEYLEEKADIICLSKGITGGMMPLGVTLMNEKVVRGFSEEAKETKFYHGHSYTANALACALACANLDLLDQNCLDSILRIQRSHEKFIQRTNHSSINEIRSLGTILAMNFNEGSNSYDHSIRDVIYDFFIKKGLLMRPLGNVCYILPPYCITNEELEEIYSAIMELAESL